MSKKEQMKDAIHRDPEQAALDLEAQMNDLAALEVAEARRDESVAQYAAAMRACASAKRRAIEAGWNVSALRAAILERWKRRKGAANGSG